MLKLLQTLKRPDIANATCEVARHACILSCTLLKTVVEILEYLNQTRKVTIAFRAGCKPKLMIFADYDYAKSKDQRRSVFNGEIMSGEGAVVCY